MPPHLPAAHIVCCFVGEKMLAALTMDWTSLLSSLNICATSEFNEPGETG